MTDENKVPDNDAATTGIPEEIPEEVKERYRLTSVMIHNAHGKEKGRYNKSAQGTIDLFRQSLPDLDDRTVFVVFSSVAYMLSTLMLTPLATVGKDVEELFDIYTLASGALLGVVDLTDETDPPTQDELRTRALEEEITRLRAELEGDASDDETYGNYL